MVMVSRRAAMRAALAGGVAAAGGRLRAEERDAVEAAARREGALALATSVTTPDFPRFLAAFTARFPYLDVDAGLYQATTGPVVARVDAEVRAGRPGFDVIHVANPAIYLDYERNDLLLAYPSPEIAAYPPNAHDGALWTAARAVGVMLAYNKNVLAPAEAPRGWRDLLAARFKGRNLAIQNAASGTWLMAVYVLERALGADYFPALAAQRPVQVVGSAQQIDMLSRGETLVAAGIDHTVLFTEASRRAGIVAVYPEEGTPVSLSPVAILKNAPHPNAARLFVDFILSHDGQVLFANEITHNYSLRGDVAAPPDQRALADVRPLTPADWRDYEAFAATFPAHFDRLFKR